MESQWLRQARDKAAQENPSAVAEYDADGGELTVVAGAYVDVDRWAGGTTLLPSGWEVAPWCMTLNSGGPIEVLGCSVRLTGRKIRWARGAAWIRVALDPPPACEIPDCIEQNILHGWLKIRV